MWLENHTDQFSLAKRPTYINIHVKRAPFMDYNSIYFLLQVNVISHKITIHYNIDYT